MAELANVKINPEAHVLLDQPLLRMTYNLSRQTFKSAQRAIEHASKGVLADFKTAQQSTTKAKGTPEATIDGMITKMTNLKRKLETLHEDEQKLNRASMARIEHLQTLYDVNSLVDVKYEEWSRTRLSRLLVDYLLRSGYTQSANALAKAKGIEDLVDIDSFLSAEKIERSLRQNHNTAMALNWCKDNEKALQKMDPNMELQLELRLQQFIEMVRAAHEKTRPWDGTIVESPDETALKESEKLLAEARAHARKYLAGEASMKRLSIAAGLLAFRHWDAIEPYDEHYSEERWDALADLFITTHHKLFSLPTRPLLHIALSAGLSALKTPSCHSNHISSSANMSSNSNAVCPICSTELNELAKNVPYAHHTKSIVESDPVVLPNGRVYGRERLQTFNEKIGTEKGWVRDPIEGINGPKWMESEVRKVFIL